MPRLCEKLKIQRRKKDKSKIEGEKIEKTISRVKESKEGEKERKRKEGKRERDA